MPMPSVQQVSLGAAVDAEIAVPPPPFRVATGGLAFAACALFFAGLAAFFYFDSPSSRGDAVPVLAAFGVLCAIAAIVALVRRARLRFRARMFEHGFTIDGTAFRFEDLEAIAIDERPRLSNGQPIGFDRLLTVRGAGSRAAVRQFVGRLDPLAAFTKTLIDRAAEAGERRLTRGVEGAGWRLDGLGVHARNGGLTPFDEITSAALFDDQVRLWRRNDETPFLSIALGSDNALTLLRLLRPRIKAREAASAGDAPPVMRAPSAPGEVVPPPAPVAGEVGRLLFERHGQRLLGVVTGCVALGIFAVPWLWMGAVTDEDRILAIAVTLFAPICLAITIDVFTLVVRFHEHAVVKRSLFRTRTHRYAAVERIKWVETRMYVHGGYAGTSRVVTLHSTGQRWPLTFSLSRSGADEDLDRVRDTIAYYVARLMERQIAAYGRVPWGGLALTNDALEIRRDKAVERLPYSMPLRATMGKGVMNFYRPNETKLLGAVSARAENFFPGLRVLQKKARLVS